jgi:hypothetical protein
METECVHLNTFILVKLIPILCLSVCICVFAFALLRLTVTYPAITHKREYFSLLWFTLTSIFWLVDTQLGLATLPVFHYLLATFLISGFSCYFLNLLQEYSDNETYGTLLTGINMFLLLIVPATFIFSQIPWFKQFYMIVITVLYLTVAFSVIHYLLSGLGRYYQIMSVLLGCAAFLMIDSTATLFSSSPGSVFAPIGLAILILTVGFNTLDRTNLLLLQELNLELRRLKKQFANESENIEDVVISLARTIDAKDKYTEGHIERVSQYAAFLGERIGLDENTLATIRIGALIHDIGKICIDLNILHKPTKLTSLEFEQIKQHPLQGEQICSPLRALRDAGVIVRCHHEKLDGSGYPNGLSGDEISLETRIVTVADIFDALTTERSYRKALTVKEALEVLRQEAGQGKLDRMLVEQFIAMLTEMEIMSPQYA